MKAIGRAVLVVLLVGAAVGATVLYQRQTRGAQAAAPVTQTAKIEKGSIFQAVASTGRVVSNLDVDIKCRASGQVIKLPFDVSQSVKKGDLLLQLDTSDQQRAVDQAQVALAVSQAKLAQAKQNLVVAEQTIRTTRDRVNAMLESAQTRARDSQAKADRRRQLLDQQLGSQEEYDQAQMDAAAAVADLASVRVQLEEIKTQELALEVKRQDVVLGEADVHSDQIALDNAKTQLSYTTVQAPMDGVVATLNTQIGTIISSGVTNVGGGTTILTLSDLSHIFVLASVDESDIGKIKVDMPVRITADAFPGRRFNGKVVRIATKGVNVSNVVTFEVKIEITDDNRRLLKPEMTTNVQIVAAEREDVLIVPAAAVSRKQGAVYATVVGAAGKTEEKQVKLGLNDGDNWEVVEGLSEGEVVQVRAEAQSRWRADQGPRFNNPFGPMGGFGGGGRGGGGGGGGRGGGR
jgi:multidrug efflux pump subunit AcrA (membrane-fusion protein)